MKYLGQPYIEWSDQLLGTHSPLIDYQHQWLLLLVNLLIHICSQNDMHINALDIVDAFCDYAFIHFTEEELLFMDNPYPFLKHVLLIFLIITAYPDKESHKKQHEVISLFLYYF